MELGEDAKWCEFCFHCSFAKLTFDDVKRIAHSVLDSGVSVDLKHTLASGKTVNKLGKQKFATLLDFFSRTDQADTTEVRIALEGNLYGLNCGLELIFDLEYSGLVLEISENRLWGYGCNSEPSDIRRFKAFIDICQSICKTKKPKFAELDSMNYSFEEISVENNKILPKYDPKKLFSEENINSIYDFYVFEYQDRLYKKVVK